MLDNIIIGQYLPGQSVLHRMDPRAKLSAIFLYIIVVFLANNWLTYAIVGVFALFTIALSRVSLRYIYKGMKPVILIVLFTFILQVLLTREGAVLYDLRWFKLYDGGLRQGIFISLRLLYLVMVTSLLTLTTKPLDITDGLESLLGPLKKIKLPVHEFALMMSIALRFIPTLLQETEKIMKAQMARGAEFTTGPILQRLKAFVPLLIPLFISSFKRAEDLALAMEARGYRGGEGRTRLRVLKWTGKDTIALFVLVVLAVGLYVLRTH
ncbi:cobalt transport family protein [Fictibacillus macauensis ZFHKF-1]|uniref:Energy-coupling factor transporter transmembrane protein EcfT n=1 Tax=Fictibacillus macauensis ZFHKF-1 TaxID=1196324 RepID=I8UAT0_9BACL|nr:energy-coupling factor transporter transmembrane component T [Fictibacillus macauensis]EIT84025.1 cobalt transport family protein [Fictibacillus macauensis ZFHKF-1]